MAITEKSSKFVGHAYRVKSNSDVKLAYKKVKLLYPESDNIPMAYSFKQYYGYHDDGEHGAGFKLEKLLKDRGTKNTAIFVTRDFGGIHLGPRRFLHIERSAKQALDELSATPI